MLVMIKARLQLPIAYLLFISVLALLSVQAAASPALSIELSRQQFVNLLAVGLSDELSTREAECVASNFGQAVYDNARQLYLPVAMERMALFSIRLLKAPTRGDSEIFANYIRCHQDPSVRSALQQEWNALRKSQAGQINLSLNELRAGVAQLQNQSVGVVAYGILLFNNIAIRNDAHDMNPVAVELTSLDVPTQETIYRNCSNVLEPCLLYIVGQPERLGPFITIQPAKIEVIGKESTTSTSPPPQTQKDIELPVYADIHLDFSANYYTNILTAFLESELYRSFASMACHFYRIEDSLSKTHRSMGLIIISIHYEGCGNSNMWGEALLFLHSNEQRQYALVAVQTNGGQIQKVTESGDLLVTKPVHMPGDGGCCPSKTEVLSLKRVGNTIITIRERLEDR
jgi:hypothetical protein